jgi:tRNA-5-taurinomethyluridine 2-sulfurtransferase
MKIAVLISGGVDSSVALRLLKGEGHELVAFYLKIWLEDELQYLGECPWEDDLAYVRAVCKQVGVPLEIVPFQKEYRERVIAYTIAEAQAGRTPNPDMLCNARIKFGAFYDYLLSCHSRAGGNPDGFCFDKIATGPYAQVEEIMCHPERNEGSREQKNRRDSSSKLGMTSQFLLKMSPDHIKDQTYFLSQLTQTQIARAVFPIGKYNKSQVRELAKKLALPNAKRKDSQGLCFLGKIPFDKFLEYHLGKRSGKLVEYETGKILGEHNGFWYFTVGQRRGIHLSGGPWYVVAKNIETNEVFISSAAQSVIEVRDEFTQHLDRRALNSAASLNHVPRARGIQGAGFTVSDLNWIFGDKPSKTKLSVKVRHGAKMYETEIEYLENFRLRVKLAEKDRGIAPGQFAVFYDGGYCLGGGVIE